MPELEQTISDGVNDHGLSAALLSLEGTQYMAPQGKGLDIMIYEVPKYLLQTCATVTDARTALQQPGLRVWAPPSAKGLHLSVRGATGASLYVEWMGGAANYYEDLNDAGTTGWGILTNEPPFPYHKTNVQYLEWRRALAPAAVGIDGAFYPAERFKRAHVLKSGMRAAKSAPNTTQQAVARVVAVLNSVTVPDGTFPGTDSGKGPRDLTLWAVVRDHNASDPALYFRSADNPSLQRLRLRDLPMTKGMPARAMTVGGGGWFIDAASRLVGGGVAQTL